MARAIPRLARQAHPVEDTLAIITIVAGLTAFALGTIHATHFVATCVGIVGFLVGLYSQLVSATTVERWINVIGIGLAFLGVGMGLAQGGFSF